MASRFTRKVRQQIVADFAKRHNGWDAGAFLREVEEAGPSHQAYGWFQWDDAEAAHAHRVNQAMEFTSGLTISFTIEEVGRKGSIRIRETHAPMVISPLAGRRQGGGYKIFDPKKKAHMDELARQAAQTLQGWLDRYEAAVLHVNEQTGQVERLIQVLSSAGQIRQAAE